MKSSELPNAPATTRKFELNKETLQTLRNSARDEGQQLYDGESTEPTTNTTCVTGGACCCCAALAE